MKCQQCGADVNPDSVYCHQCGARLAKDEPLFTAEPDQRGAAFEPNTASRPPASASAARRDSAEEVLWEGTYSPKAMLGAFVLDGLVWLAGIVLAILFPALMWLSLGGAAVFSAVVFLLMVYRQWSVRYRLTSQRFFHQHGLLSRTTDRVEVIDMDDITCFQGPIDRLVGVGSIRITSSDRTHPELWVRGVENVQQIATAMDDARRAERIRRGFHIESV